MWSWLSCEKYTVSASKALDENLSLRERLRFKVHHFICLNCRRFKRQMQLVNQACERLGADEALVDQVSSKKAPERLKSRVLEGVHAKLAQE